MLTPPLKTVGMLAAGVFAGEALWAGAKKAVRFFEDSAKAAVSEQSALRKLGVALKNTTGATSAQSSAVNDWLDKQAEQTGIMKSEMFPAFQQLTQATGSISEAQKEMGLAMDVSAGTGKSLTTVTTALMKAHNGTTASLSRLGLKTKDAAGNTLSLKDAMATMASTFKGQAQAKAQSLEGTIARLHETLGVLQVRRGQEVQYRRC